METQTNQQHEGPDARDGRGPRAGMVAVIGRANAGKSTLVNALLREKVSIVSPIAQTTRNLIRGVLTESRGQLVFLDTPGVHKASHDLGKVMNRAARASIEGVDIALLMVDAATPVRQEDEGWMRRLMREEVTCFVALNKQDAGTKAADAYRRAWEATAAELAPDRTAHWFSVSALKGDGLPELLQALFDYVPEGPYLFPEDILTDFPRKLAMADVVREKLLRGLRDELPHNIAVLTNEIDDTEEPWVVQCHIFVRKASQKGIVIGHKGRRLRATKRSAERELAEMYGHPIKLDLWIKVDKSWPNNFWMLRKLGYVE